ncbi:unnamed protein product [Peronospora belbahrii]|uniref:Secreted protein n=1 Tax=Peronospora belbahrii TaxID=622444 RepID=A0AAU9KX56_9STRA|nr:unnamed protein product [Peronospora belbahrii]
MLKMLMYQATFTRLDLAYAVGNSSCFVASHPSIKFCVPFAASLAQTVQTLRTIIQIRRVKIRSKNLQTKICRQCELLYMAQYCSF